MAVAAVAEEEELGDMRASATAEWIARLIIDISGSHDRRIIDIKEAPARAIVDNA